MKNSFATLFVILFILQAVAFISFAFAPENFALVAILTLLLAVAGLPFPRRDAPRPWQVLTLTITTVLGIYLLLCGAPLPDGYADTFSSVEWWVLQNAGILAMVFAVAAFFRPSLGAITISLVTWTKMAQCATILGDSGVRSDYQPLTEIGFFLLLGWVVAQYYRRYTKSDGQFAHKAVTVVVMLAITAHLANYFYSGLTKLLLGGGVLHWALHNRTDFLVINSYLAGMIPFRPLTEALFPHLELLMQYTNWITLIIQLLAVVGLVSVPAAILLTLCYDTMHLSIFFLSGIFFWKWIVLNTAIVTALGLLRGDEVFRRLRWWSVAFVLATPLCFSTMRMAWYDTPAWNNMHFVAVTREGLKFNVPSNYFLDFSIYTAHVELPYRGYEGVVHMGMVPDYMSFDSAMHCTLPKEAVDPFPDKERVEHFIRAHHADILKRANAQGVVDYNFFPHHFWSNIPQFADFYALDKREIVAYEFTVELRCTTLEDGRPSFKSLKKNVLRIAVTP